VFQRCQWFHNLFTEPSKEGLDKQIMILLPFSPSEYKELGEFLREPFPTIDDSIYRYKFNEIKKVIIKAQKRRKEQNE